MLCKFALTAALLAVPAAARGLLGFAVGMNKPAGECKTTTDYRLDFQQITSQTDATIVRTYSNADPNGQDCDVVRQILPAARENSLRVLLGTWCVIQVTNREHAWS
jgi:glucan 1,3-beta-glucosidase